MVKNQKQSKFTGLFCILAILFFAALFELTAQSVSQDSEPKLLSAPNFVLSGEAVAAGIDGEMSVSLAVDKTGTVKNVSILAGSAWPCGSFPGDEIENVRKANSPRLRLPENLSKYPA